MDCMLRLQKSQYKYMYIQYKLESVLIWKKYYLYKIQFLRSSYKW